MNSPYLLRSERVVTLAQHIASMAPRLREYYLKLAFPAGREHPYYNLVLQGGGTLGIAHLGAIYGLELAGIRFVGLAGTSAGAIVALLMACAKHKLDDPVAERLMPILEGMPTSRFVDGPSDARRFVQYCVGSRHESWFDLVVPIAQTMSRVRRRRGVNPGYAFEDWLRTTIEQNFSIRTIADLHENLRPYLTELGTWAGCFNGSVDMASVLHLIATAMPMGVPFVFPRDLHLLDRRYEEHSPAIMARASMAVPLFFEPYVVHVDRLAWSQHLRQDIAPRWKDIESIAFIDGGLFSNFPIDSFITYPSPKNPRFGLSFKLPTIGIRLEESPDRDVLTPDRGIAGILRHSITVADAVRGQRDRQAIEFTNSLILNGQLSKGSVEMCTIDTGTHDWLDFNLSENDSLDLFCRGMHAVVKFVRGAQLDECAASG